MRFAVFLAVLTTPKPVPRICTHAANEHGGHTRTRTSAERNGSRTRWQRRPVRGAWLEGTRWIVIMGEKTADVQGCGESGWYRILTAFSTSTSCHSLQARMCALCACVRACVRAKGVVSAQTRATIQQHILRECMRFVRGSIEPSAWTAECMHTRVLPSDPS